LPTEHKKVTVLICWKDKTWEERDLQLMMPVESTAAEIGEQAIKATMSNISAIGKLEDLRTMGIITGEMNVEIKGKKEDASPH
jgi:hypothetical protein